jgi:hypothetical protein
MKKHLAVVPIVFLIACFSLAAKAADMYIDNEKFGINISGEIRQGDAEHFVSLIENENKRNRIIQSLYINSSGGDLQEAMRLAKLVNGLHIDVRVTDGGYCVSACFIILLEGYSRTFNGVPEDWENLSPELLKFLDTPFSKTWEKSGFVGIHRPYLKSPSGNVGSTKKQEDLMRQVRLYLASKAVPQHLIDEMMSRPSNDIYWLKDSDIALIGEFNPGDEETLIAKCGYKRFKTMVSENWSEEKVDQVLKCMSGYWYEQYIPLQHKFIVKLSIGWRPWQDKK